MAQRQKLQDLLKTLGTSNVYFQAPSGDRMQYPAIVYAIDDEDSKHADNQPYHRTKKYQVTIIDRSPDSEISDKVGNLSMSSFKRFFVKDGLNHFIYDLFF